MGSPIRFCSLIDTQSIKRRRATMRFVAALTSAPLVLASIDYVEFCNNEDSRWNLNQDVTDALSCTESFKAKYDGSCDDLPDKSNEQHACVFDWWNNALDQDDEYASEEFINNEFLANINDDPMMAEILSTLNAQNRFMENYNCDNDGEGGFTNCQPKDLCGDGDDPSIDNCAAQRSTSGNPFEQTCYDQNKVVILNPTNTTQCYNEAGEPQAATYVGASPMVLTPSLPVRATPSTWLTGLASFSGSAT